MTDSAAGGWPRRPARVAAGPSFITPPCARFLSSACCTTTRPKVRAYSSARRIRSAFITGMPSSLTAMMPTSFISPISASDSPLSPLEMAPIGCTRTMAASRARRTIKSVTERLSLGGLVFGMQQTVENPPAAAARAPDAMSSLYSWPGSRRCTCRSMNPGATTLPVQSMTRAPSARAPASTARTTPSSINTSVILSISPAGAMTRPPLRRRAAGTPNVYRGASIFARPQTGSFDANHGGAERLDQVRAGGAHRLGVLALDRHLDLVLGRRERRVAAHLDGAVRGDDPVELMGDVAL